MIINLPTPGYAYERILMNQFDAIDYALAEWDKKINEIREVLKDEQEEAKKIEVCAIQ